MYEYRAEIVRIIDGDTVVAAIDLGFHVTIQATLRLFGINAPEQRGENREAGKHATAHLATMIAEDLPIRIRTQKGNQGQDEQGKYGRYLATLYGASGANLNQRMVYHGYAVSVDYR